MALLSCLLLYNNTAYDSLRQCILHIVFLITLCDALPDTFPGFSSACVAALLRLPLVCLIYPSICSLSALCSLQTGGRRTRAWRSTWATAPRQTWTSWRGLWTPRSSLTSWSWDTPMLSTTSSSQGGRKIIINGFHGVLATWLHAMIMILVHATKRTS